MPYFRLSVGRHLQGDLDYRAGVPSPLGCDHPTHGLNVHRYMAQRVNDAAGIVGWTRPGVVIAG